MTKRPTEFSEDPRWVLFEGRGGKMKVGEFLEYVEEDRIAVLTAPGTLLSTTIIKEDAKLTPQELCRRYNLLFEEICELRESQ